MEHGREQPEPRDTITPNRFVAENEFISQKRERTPLPTFKKEQSKLPRPIWEGHDDAVDCYYRTWELAFKNLKRPSTFSGFVSNYIDIKTPRLIQFNYSTADFAA